MPHTTSGFTVLLALGLLPLALSSCDSTAPAAPKPPTIVQFESAYFNDATDTLYAGERLDFFGSVMGKPSLSSWSLAIQDTAGQILSNQTMPVLSGSSISFDLPGKSANNLYVVNPGTWGPTGIVVARLTVSTGSGLTATKDIRFVASTAPKTVP